jgi:hypothetical protein
MPYATICSDSSPNQGRTGSWGVELWGMESQGAELKRSIEACRRICIEESRHGRGTISENLSEPRRDCRPPLPDS